MNASFSRSPERELRDRPRFFTARSLAFTLTLALAAAFAFTGVARAAELSPGLTYVRGDTAPDAAVKALGDGSVVLDLRFTTDADVATLLSQLKTFRTHPKRTVLVLLSPETSADARKQLAAILPGAITFGRSAPDFKTDIIVTTSPEADKRSHDALLAGTAPEKLIVENADKPRFDELALAREHRGDPEPPAAPATPASTDKAAAPVSSDAPASADQPTTATASIPPAKPAPALVDSVLQRAVQVYRGLVAFKRL